MSSNNRKHILLIPSKDKRSNEHFRQEKSFKTTSQCYNHNMVLQRDILKYNNINKSNDLNNERNNNISKISFYDKLFQSASSTKKFLHKIHMELYNEDSGIKNETKDLCNIKKNKNSFRLNAKTSKNFKEAFGISGINNSNDFGVFVDQIHNNSNARIIQYNKVINSISQQLPYKKCGVKLKDKFFTNNILNDDEAILDKTAFTSNPHSKKNSIQPVGQQGISCNCKKLTKSHSYVNTNSKKNHLKTKTKTKTKMNIHNKRYDIITSSKKHESNKHIETCSVFDFVDERNKNEAEFPLGEEKFKKVNSYTDIKKGLFNNKMNYFATKNCKGKKLVCISSNINSVSTKVKGGSTNIKRVNSVDHKELVLDKERERNYVDENSEKNWKCNIFSNVLNCC